MWEKGLFFVLSIMIVRPVRRFFFCKFKGDNLVHHQMSIQEWQKSLEEGRHIQLYHFRLTRRLSHLSGFEDFVVTDEEGGCFDAMIDLVARIGWDGNCC